MLFNKRIEDSRGACCALPNGVIQNGTPASMDRARVNHAVQIENSLAQQTAEYESWLEEEIRLGRITQGSFEWDPLLY